MRASRKRKKKRSPRSATRMREVVLGAPASQRSTKMLGMTEGQQERLLTNRTTNLGKTTTIMKEREGATRTGIAKEIENARETGRETGIMKGVTKDTKGLGPKSEEMLITEKIEIEEMLTMIISKMQGRRGVPEKIPKKGTKKLTKKNVRRMTKTSIRVKK